MKNRIFWYSVVTFVVSLLVTTSVLMPGVLLSRTEDSILSSPATVSTGISFSQHQNATAASKMPTPSVVSVAQMTRSVQLYEQGADHSVLSNASTNGSMDIQEAVDTSIKQITTLLQKSALPPLTRFPQAYAVNAQLKTITDKYEKPVLQYWNIDFNSLADQSTNATKIAVALDAQTGMFLSINLSIEISVNNPHKIDLANSTKAIAQSMNISGKMFSLDPNQVPPTAQWKFNDSSLFMQVTLEQQPGFTSFTMTMSTKYLQP